jgi:hypothetical protein
MKLNDIQRLYNADNSVWATTEKSIEGLVSNPVGERVWGLVTRRGDGSIWGWYIQILFHIHTLNHDLDN